jgi:hypothetical protein
VVGGGVAACLAGTQQPGERLPAGDIGPVQVGQQRMEAFSELKMIMNSVFELVF